MNNHLEYITKKCVEANPSILDLELGCKTIHGIYTGKNDVQGEYYFMTKEDVNGDSEQFACDDFSKRKGEILGREIQLSDVLLAIIKKEGEKLGNSGKIFDHYMEAIFAEIIRKWNLFKPLSGQSPEVWEFIFNLLQ